MGECPFCDGKGFTKTPTRPNTKGERNPISQFRRLDLTLRTRPLRYSPEEAAAVPLPGMHSQTEDESKDCDSGSEIERTQDSQASGAASVDTDHEYVKQHTFEGRHPN